MSARCRELAVQMGATLAVDPTDTASTAQWAEEGGYFDVCFEASGSPAAIASTASFTRLKSSVVQLGMGHNTVEMPLGLLLVKEIKLVGSFRFIDEFTTSVRWLESGRIDPLPLLSAEFNQDQVVEALELAGDKSKAAKVQLIFV